MDILRRVGEFPLKKSTASDDEADAAADFVASSATASASLEMSEDIQDLPHYSSYYLHHARL